jgi:ribosomal protein L11 methyltransferase
MSLSERYLAEAILKHIRQSLRRQTPTAVAMALQKSYGASRRQIRDAISLLLTQQELVYAYEMGCSFLIENTLRAWQATAHIWISPPQHTLLNYLSSETIHVRLQPGGAFGSDGHPSTRLCLQALDHLYVHKKRQRCFVGPAIDIGTGSGILAIVAARFGSPSILALDIDPCARNEATCNVALNRCQDRIRVSGNSYKECINRFHLILANLRLPTLMHMLPWAVNHLHPEGRMIMSGYLLEESPSLDARCDQLGLTPTWDGFEKRWAGGCFAWKGSQRPNF